MRAAAACGRGLVRPEPPSPTTAQLVEAVAAIAAPVAAIEGVRDGDTQGWLVRLVAIVRRPGAYTAASMRCR